MHSTSTDDSDLSNDSKQDRDLDYQGDSSATESVFKLPTIEGSRTNSVTSFMSTPNSNSRSRRQSRERSRRRVCRSPSCPSSLKFSGQRSVELESPTPNDKTLLNLCSGEDDNEFKLPNIYRNSNSLSVPTNASEKVHPWQSARDVDQMTRRTLRRTESCRDAYNIGSSGVEVKANHQRSQGHTALLLPIRNSDTRVSVKGKKKKSSQSSPRSYQDFPNHIQKELTNGAQNGWESEYDSDIYDSGRGQAGFDRIMEEDTSTHADIASSRKIKPWLTERQKEGQVKA